MQSLHIFEYLEIHNMNDLAFDPLYQRVTSYYDIQSKVKAMKAFFVDDGEKIPINSPNQAEN